MNTGLSQANNHTWAPFWITVIFGVPALIAYLCAAGLHDGTLIFLPGLWLPGLWFVYSVSEEVAVFGIVLSLGVSAGAVIRHTLTGWMIVWTAFSIAGAGYLIWHGAQIARLSL